MPNEDIYKTNRNNFRDNILSRNIISSIVAATILTTILVLGISNISAQEMSKNMTAKMIPNFTGSIDYDATIAEAFKAKVTVTMVNAITTAQNSVGPNSVAKEAELDEAHGYLVYKVTVVDPTMKKFKVLVDPGNGGVLLKKEITWYDHKDKDDKWKDKKR